jgi:BolA protein
MIEQRLKDILEKTFSCKELVIMNQSHLHHGHAGSPNSGQSHFHVLIVSDDFQNLTRVQRHQLVNRAVQGLFDEGLHALSLDLRVEQNS